jgi:hypothetical protein
LDIEFTTTTKKLTKSAVKQMELANWITIENQFKENPSTEFYKVNDAFKFSVAIFKGFNGDWYYFPLHKYSISCKGDDAYINGSMHCFIGNKKKAELFIENVDLILSRITKIII